MTLLEWTRASLPSIVRSIVQFFALIVVANATSVLIAPASYAQAPDLCVEDGGNALCTEPEVGSWKYAPNAAID